MAARDLLSKLSGGELPGFPLLTKESPESAGKQAPSRSSGPSGPSVIVAGQQPYLLTGPLFTILKAATAISLSRRLSEECKRDIRPLFWIASEDHDITEVNRTYVRGRKLVCPYNAPLKSGQLPQAGQVGLSEEKTHIIGQVNKSLSSAPYKSYVLELLESCSFESYSTLFTDMLSKLFKPWKLETIEPFTLRDTTGPVLARLCERWPETESAFRRGTERVSSCGFKTPLPSLGFFEIVNGKRVAASIQKETVSFSTGTYSFQEAAEVIRENPRRFSPGAALRPVLQDAALPVIGTVAGPTELNYLWQIQEIYEVAEVTSSRLSPRISATFIDSKLREKIENSRYGLRAFFSLLQDMQSGLENVSSPELDSVVSAAQALFDSLEKAQTPANSKWLSRSRKTIHKTVQKAIDRLKREAIVPQGNINKIAEELLPRGKLQERSENVLGFLGAYGPEWINRLCEDMDPWRIQHTMVTVDS